jgi:hypothetical protein
MSASVPEAVLPPPPLFAYSAWYPEAVFWVGHPDAGWRSAVIYSIVGTCKLLNVNPEGYLTWYCLNSPRRQ